SPTRPRAAAGPLRNRSDRGKPGYLLTTSLHSRRPGRRKLQHEKFGDCSPVHPDVRGYSWKAGVALAGLQVRIWRGDRFQAEKAQSLVENCQRLWLNLQPISSQQPIELFNNLLITLN